MKRYALILVLVPALSFASAADSLDALFGLATGAEEPADPDFDRDELLDLEGASGTFEWTADGDLVFVPDAARADEPQAPPPCRAGLDEKARSRCKTTR